MTPTPIVFMCEFLPAVGRHQIGFGQPGQGKQEGIGPAPWLPGKPTQEPIEQLGDLVQNPREAQA